MTERRGPTNRTSRPYQGKAGGFAKPGGPGKPFARSVSSSLPGQGNKPGVPEPVPQGNRAPRPYPAKPTGGFTKPGGSGKPFARPITSSFPRQERRPVAPPPAPPEAQISLGARMVALDVLLDVHQRGAYASLALDERLNKNRILDPRDKRLATELAYGTLENQLRLDYMIDFFLDRKDVEVLVRDILRMGVYQLFFLDRVPGSAAVDEAVKLTRAKDREAYTGLVNAILRNMLRDKQRITYPKPSEEPARFLSVMHSLPQWIVEALIEAYGLAGARAIAEYRAPEPTVTVRPNTARISVEEFAAYVRRRHFDVQPGIVPGAFRLKKPGDLTAEPEYQRGLFSIQGESSMLAVQALDPQRGWTVLDACAAPGGKTALLAERMHGTGRIQAWDVHEHRVELLRAMVRRLHLDNVRPAQRDALLFRQELERAMDAVLIDAPCSGLGVMLNKPDVKYRQTPEAVEALTHMQSMLLDTCCRYVKPGGVLVYSTCSILPAENQNQITAFLQKHPEFALEGLAERMPEALRERVEQGQLQLLPYRDGIDGFYIARMVRKEE